MNTIKRLGSFTALAIISVLSTTPTKATTITGTFQGAGLVEITPYVNGLPGMTASYSVPATLDFTLTANGPPNAPEYLALSIANSIYSLGTSSIATNPLNTVFLFTSITDGIPGQSADSAGGYLDSFEYHAYALSADFSLFDPSGQFIGPNGNGDPSNVSIVADITYAKENAFGNVETVFVSFQTVPEPTSLVLVASGALSILAFALARARQRG
jgi:hypothetical protein